MKKDIDSILHEFGKFKPISKIRGKSLKKLLMVYFSIFLMQDTRIRPNDIINNKKIFIEEIKDLLKINTRAAYDYYNTLLYIDACYSKLFQLNMEKWIESSIINKE